MFSARLSRGLGALGVIALFSAGLMTTQHASAAPRATWSWTDPPPLCSAAGTGGDAGACVAQPVPDVNQMPTFNHVSYAVLAEYPGTNPTYSFDQATFVITQLATPNSGQTLHPVEWDDLTAFPVGGKYTDPSAVPFYLTQKSDCTGDLACTYVTGYNLTKPGWYVVMGPNGFTTLQEACAPDNPGNCAETESQTAVYVPASTDKDLQPPEVGVSANGKGLTTKAVANFRDPYGKAVSLKWDFGDGTRAAGALGKVVTHTYSTPGDYQVTALVTTSDGRYSAASTDAGITMPQPAAPVVDRIGTGTTGVATGVVQGWPSGAKAEVKVFTADQFPDGCPTDVVDNAPYAEDFSRDAIVNSDGTVSMSFDYLDPNPTGYVLEVTDYSQHGNEAVQGHAFSACVPATSTGTAAATTGTASPGDTTIPVDPSTVATGHVAVIDPGTTSAEWRTVTGKAATGLTVSSLSNSHAPGAYVMDAGPPPSTYTVPGPPNAPGLPALPAIPPLPPTITATKATKSAALVVTFKPGDDGGSPVTKYDVSCVSTDKGKTRTATGQKSPVTVKGATRLKHYMCAVQAWNKVGAGSYSAYGSKVLVPKS